MKKVLTLAAATLAVSAVTTQAAITVTLEDNQPWCPGLTWEGTWTPLVADSVSTAGIPAPNWSATLTVDKIGVLGSDVYVVRVDGNHEIPAPGPTWTGVLGLLDLAGQVGSISGSVVHGPPIPPDDIWTLDAWVVGAGGEIGWKVTSCHVPEPSTYAMLAGLGLAGFALYRRMKA